jgi:hypothetical protein
MFLEFTHKSDGKAVLINMALVRYVYPMADGCDLIFDANHSASVSESPAEIRQWLATAHDRKVRGRKARRPTVDASLQAIAAAAKGQTT